MYRVCGVALCAGGASLVTDLRKATLMSKVIPKEPRSGRACRILYIEDAYHLGGDSKTSLSLLERLDHSRFEVTLVTSDAGGVYQRALTTTGLDHVPVRFGVRAGYLEHQGPLMRLLSRTEGVVRMFALASRLLWLVLHRGIDVIMSRDRTRSCLLAAVLSSLTRRPHVFYPGCHFHPWTGRLRRWVARHARLVVGNSGFTTASYVAAGVDPDRAVTVYNSIDPAPFLADGDRRFRATAGIPKEAFVFGWLGSWLDVKGVYDVIEAFALVNGDHPEAHLLLVGGGNSSRGRSLIKGLGIAGRTHVMPFQVDVAAAYRAIDVFLMASWDEPFGRVTIEAMAAGLPVIGTDSGATPEVVVNGETGMLVPPRSPARLAEAMAWILEHPQAWKDWGSRGRRRVLARFVEERRTREIEALLEGVASQAQPGLT